ncbi:MAG: LysE family transporter [Candidatus Saganbacteria bacterium]|nr:LysE family transporter [Candidatus Saganbacteria bacterium]
MDYFSIFTVSFVIALSGAMAPGPLLTTTIAESVKHGYKTGPLLILGHAIIEIGMLFLLVFGLNRVIDQPGLLRAISLLGSVILLYFGTSLIWSLPKLQLDLKPHRLTSHSLILRGLLISLINPYWTIWWLTVGIGLVLAAQQAGPTALAVFFCGHILADLLWYSLVSFTVSRGKRLISPPVYKLMMLVCGLVLIGFGFYFGASSF